MAQILEFGIHVPPILGRVCAGNIDWGDGGVVVLAEVDVLSDATHPGPVMALGGQTAALVPFERVAYVDCEVVFPFEFFGEIGLLVVDHVRPAELFEVEVRAISEYVFAVEGICRVWEDAREGENG